MMASDVLKVGHGSDDAEVVRFVFRFGLPQVGWATGYGLWAMGHGP